jgi:ATP-dependent helicase/nuclease subunit B
MPLHLLTAPAGAGKTQYIIEQIRAASARAPIARCLVIVPSHAQLAAFRERLGASAPVILGVTLTDFHTLYRDLLDAAGTQVTLLSHPARYRLLRAIVRQLAATNQLAYFAPIAEKPGFIHAVADLIAELKENLVSPRRFANLDLGQIGADEFAATPGAVRPSGPSPLPTQVGMAVACRDLQSPQPAEQIGTNEFAATPGAVRPSGPSPLPTQVGMAVACRDLQSPQRDLTTIYTAYQNLLREHHLADREGMGWLALDALRADSHLHAHLAYIAVDGFDEFTPTQRALLDELAARVPQLDVTLTYQADRRAHTRLVRTLATFGDVPCEKLAPLAPPRAAPLEHLERYLFESNAPRVAAGAAVTLVAAPDRAREVRAIARAVKRLLLDGTPPQAIGVLFRRLEPYQTLVREIFAEFAIPFHIEQGMTLLSNPLIAALVNLLTLSANDFPWRDTRDALHSPYFFWRDLNHDAVTRIEQIAREAIVVKGRAQWLAAFVQPTTPWRADEPDTRLVTQLDAATLATLREQLARWFDRITPPERATAREYVAWIEQLVGPDPRAEEWQRQHFPEQFNTDTSSLRVIERARQGDTPDIVARDLGALTEWTNLLRGILDAAEILNEGELTWRDFLADLRDALEATTYAAAPTSDGRVVISSVLQTRGVPKEYIFLGGLIESEFPLRPPEDPLLTAEERDALRAAGVSLACEWHDETTLFYEAVTLARKRLTLTYATYDDDANPLYPSPYLDAVKAILTDIPQMTLSLNEVPTIVHAASRLELGVALTRALAQGDASARALEAQLQHASPAWQHSRLAREIQARREAAIRDEYNGVIRDEELRAEFAHKFGENYLWSASQFNEWGACGFRFFARRLLQLQEITDPQEGLDVLTLGALYHEILAETYREFQARHLVVTPSTLDEAQRILQTTAERLLADAPSRLAFRPTAWWQSERDEIMRHLLRLLAVEAERYGDDAPVPFAFEVPFGFAGKPALRLELPIGTIRLIGKIDRMDRTGAGVVLIDYKTGSTPISAREVLEGRNLQLPIYVLAAQAHKHRVADAFFLHIHSAKTSGELSKVDRHEWLNAAKEHINRYVMLARAGEFAVAPTQFENGRCQAHCEFASLCRVG